MVDSQTATNCIHISARYDFRNRVDSLLSNFQISGFESDVYKPLVVAVLLLSMLSTMLSGSARAGMNQWVSNWSEWSTAQALTIDPATPFALNAGVYGGGMFKGSLQVDPVTTMASGLDHPNFITIDQNNIYWTETTYYPNNVMVKKTPLSGGAIRTLATVPSGWGMGGTGIAADSSTVYWAVNYGSGSGEIYKVPIVGGSATALATANQPNDIAVDSTHLYWSEENGGTYGSNAERKVSINGGS